MRRKAEVTHLALLARFHEELGGAARRQNALHVIHRTDRVELVKIEVIGVQAAERLLELLARPRRVALLRLAGEKDILAVRLQRRPQLLLGFALPVGRRDVEVVDAPFHRLRDLAIGIRLFHSHHHNAAKADDREAHAIAIPALRKHAFVLGGCGRGDGGAGEKTAAFHSTLLANTSSVAEKEQGSGAAPAAAPRSVTA